MFKTKGMGFMKLLVKNALVYSGGKIQKSDVFIENSRIHSLGISISSNGADRVFDFKNKCLLIPGFVDVHVHLREPGFLIRKRLNRAPQPLQGQATTPCAPCPI